MKPTSEQIRYTEKVTAALLRAAKRARRLAQQTGTEIVVMRDGKLVREIPSNDEPTSERAQSA